MHVLPELEALEKAYPTELIIIGVHSAKFPNEREAENVRQAILRHQIAHPVVNDDQFIVWRSYGVRAWPTLTLIDPEGYVVAVVAGEGHGPLLRERIGELIQVHREKGTFEEKPLFLGRERMPEGLLAFPGKVLVDALSKRLFIADTGHHRVVVTDLRGKILGIAGCGEPGVTDGPFEEARFRAPQGLALAGESLYVADTENHLLRRLDLKSKRVETIAGTGRQGRALYRFNSPWDLCLKDGRLYIAVAGCHQIWVMELATGGVEPFAGTGVEEIIDGPRLEGALAQPSGVATDGKVLYIADSETSAIRAIDLTGPGRLSTLVGQGLFVFGDRDGIGGEVRLQHPLGVACAGGKVYIADTYNHKVKVLYPTMRAVKTLFGTGKAGVEDGQQGEFYEPGGLDLTEDQIYIADTNNHRIRAANLSTGEITTLGLFI